MRIKGFFICLFLLSVVICDMRAQEKESVTIDQFSRSREVPLSYAEKVQDGVVAGFVQRGRHNVKDIDGFSHSKLNTEIITSEFTDFIDVERSQNVSKQTKSRYVICGTISAYMLKHEAPRSRGEKSRYTATFVFKIGAYDAVEHSVVGDREIQVTAINEHPDKADYGALAKIPSAVEGFINQHFKFETKILKLGELNKRGKLKDVYIHCGSSLGVHPSDLFIVYAVEDIGGVAVRTKIGKLRVTEVMSGEVSRCAVPNGSEDIIAAMNAGAELILESDLESLL